MIIHKHNNFVAKNRYTYADSDKDAACDFKHCCFNSDTIAGLSDVTFVMTLSSKKLALIYDMFTFNFLRILSRYVNRPVILAFVLAK